MNHLIAGGAGFLGGHLAKSVLDRGGRVVVLDNLITGKKENIPKGADFIQEDVSFWGWELPWRVDRVWHLASPASPPRYRENPWETIAANTKGTENLVRLAKENKARFLYASTSEVYGDPEVHPQTEEYKGSVETLGPRACYDVSKRMGETIVWEGGQLGVECRIARIFNTYGTQMDPRDGRVVTNMVGQALLNKPLTLFGDGLQTRSFCYVDDMVEGLVALMESNDLQATPVNLGNDKEITMVALADTIERVVGSNCGRIEKPLPQDDPQRRRPDLSRARRFLSWSPKVELEDGLRMVVDWFKEIGASGWEK
ncbi:NAD-dependent epimerase/dehydratase family protein [bacterium]|nr:NAD-dependent epimerase/dehydratase family protein [bacterium]